MILLLRVVPDFVRRIGFRSYYGGNQAYLDALEDIGGYQVYFDGCKSLPRLELLRTTQPSMKVIHLIKDPRAFAYSCAKQGVDAETAMEDWIGYNSLAQRYRSLLGPERYLLVRYADLVGAPDTALRRIYAFLGLPPREGDLTSIDPSELHISGNRMRLTFTKIQDKSREWCEHLDRTAAERALASASRHSWAREAVDPIP